MNSNNFNVVNITKEDYFALPPAMRAHSSAGPWVAISRFGMETFVRANIIELSAW